VGEEKKKKKNYKHKRTTKEKRKKGNFKIGLVRILLRSARIFDVG
jgi:hypothetical protein